MESNGVGMKRKNGYVSRRDCLTVSLTTSQHPDDFVKNAIVTLMVYRAPCCWWPIGHLRGWRGPSGFGAKSSWRDVLNECKNVRQRTIIITGATAGIGLETLKAFASTGATIIIGARDETKARNIACELMGKTQSIVRVEKLDLSSLESVRRFAQSFNDLGLSLDILINNAGLMPCPYDDTKNRDLSFHVNFLSHFYLTELLLPSMSTGARVVNVTSEIYRFSYPSGIRFPIDDAKGYDAVKSYGQSKLALLLWTLNQANYLQERGVEIFAVHPGSVRTAGSETARRSSSGWRGAILHCIGAPFVKDVSAGASTIVFCAAHDVAIRYAHEGYRYFASCNPRGVTAIASNSDLARRLIDYATRACDR